MTALFVDNLYAVWRVRLNNWCRVDPLRRDGVVVEWRSLRRYDVRVGDHPVKIFRGGWAEVIGKIAHYVADAKTAQTRDEEPPSSAQPVCMACGDGEGVIAVRGDDATPCPLCGETGGEVVF